jgi:alpha-L-fucosidase
MFVCLDPSTWQGREYDNHSLPLARINPTKLNTDQWCETAKLWDAKLILFVAKHTGGFCWWQTATSDYGVRNTARLPRICHPGVKGREFAIPIFNILLT